MFVNNSINDGQILIGFFLGAALINAFYSIFMFIRFKEKGNPVLFIFIASLGLAIWIFSEYIFKYFNLNNNWWSDEILPIFIFASLAASIQLCLLIFNPGKTNLLLKKILIYERNVFIVFLILPMFIQSAIYIKLSAFGAILTIVSISISVFMSLKQWKKKNILYLIGFGLFFIGMMPYILISFDILQNNFLSDWGIQIGFFFLLMFSSFTIFDTIRNLKNEKYLLELKLNETLEQSDEVLRENVEERTQEINKINIMLMDRAIELGSINQITEKVNSSLDLNDVLQSACRELIKIFPIKNASIALLNDDRENLIIVAFYSNDKIENNFIGKEINLEANHDFKKVIDSSQTLQIENAIFDSEKNEASNLNQLTGIKNILIVPIKSQIQIIGVIILPAIESNYHFNQGEIDLAEAVAEKVANSVGNARLYSKTEKALNVAASDLEIGKEIQAGFFPDVIQEIKGWEVFAYFKAARQVSGDFYDLFQINESKYTAFVIADVCDKGVGAALFMVLFRSLLRAFSNNTKEISDIQQYLKNIILNTNNYIAETHQNANMFASIFFGILDTESCEIYYINGGLDAPFVINNKGEIINRLLPTGPVVGMFPDMEFNVKSLHLNKGDILFAFTDGSTDAKNNKQELFGEEALTKIIAAPWSSGFSMTFHLNSILKKHMGFQNQYDDITQLALRRKFVQDENKHSIIREAYSNNLEELRDFVEAAVIHSGLNKDIAFAFKLATEEICTNIINYGYEGQDKGTIEIEFNLEKDKAVLNIFDYGKHFPPEGAEIPNINTKLEDIKIGGLGLVLVNGLMDNVDYIKQSEGRNLLILEKNLNSIKSYSEE